VNRLAEARWEVGRAEMLYRDLIPDREGGRIIASHIRIPRGGEVPDYVHFHRVRFQLIYCWRGWVRVVYQDQGPPFVLEPGDCVLQPPAIRHRVLECSPGLEVIEVASPAHHETSADPDLALPTASLRPERDFDGQRFARHQAARASWRRRSGVEVRDLGIAGATGGLVSAEVVRVTAAQAELRRERSAFAFVLEGDRAGDAFIIAAGEERAPAGLDPGAELLLVDVPAG
jgi:quercetin dioxygenase-like cupin family protein